MWNWSKYTQNAKNRLPIGFLVEAVKILKSIDSAGNNALDIGCGAGVDVKYMAENGFNVEAIDSDLSSIEQTKKICAGLPVIATQKDIKDFDIKPNHYQLIIAWNILSFLKEKDEINNLLLNIKNGLVKDGIFVFSIFGPEDDWVKNGFIKSFWTIDEIKKILLGMIFLKISEEKQKGKTAAGENKFWHKIMGISQKL